MVTAVWLETAVVATGNLALLAPAGTVTLAGTVATDVLLLDRVTTAPPLGAAPLSVTRPVDGTPPLTVVGVSVTEDKVREAGGGGPPGGVPGLEPELLPPHEYNASENVTSPSAAASPRPGRETNPKWQSMAQTSSPAIHATIQPSRAADAPENGPVTNPAGAAARAVVCRVTVAVAGLAPLSVTAGGAMVQLDAGGSPPQVSAMV